MNNDWQVGDLAECIADNWSINWPENPKCGDILRVSVVGLYYDELALGFQSLPERHGFNANAFRKIQPDNKACDVGFLALIKRGRRTPVNV